MSVAFKLPPYVCMRLIYVRIVYAVFRVLDGRIRPIERKLVLWVLNGGHRPVEPICLVCMNYIL